MTGAMLLPSTDNMIKQYGGECLGSCGNFLLRLVQDDPEKMDPNAPVRVLRTRISRASTYAYFQNCPAERGCSIVLRGANRNVLAEVKRIIRFSVSIAYHLRLEVAFYADRFANLPECEDDDDYDDGSDVDDEVVRDSTELEKIVDTNPVIFQLAKSHPQIKVKKERLLLSTSLDIDFNLPYRRELIGTTLFRSKNLAKCNVESHQTLLITSLLMGEGASSNVSAQKAPADVKGIKYYTKHDIALGQFVLDNCFQFARGGPKETKMLDQQLSFVHRPGRIDIVVKKVEGKNNPDNDNASSSTTAIRDYTQLPLYISSYCKECQKVISPSHLMSEEVFKMSFGKFLEIMFYNRSARCTVNGCHHSIRDCHVLSIASEHYVAVFEFIPTYPYTLHVRNHMEFPQDFYWYHNVSILNKLPERHAILMEDFRLSMMVLEREIKDLLSSRPEDMTLAMADVHLMESELQLTSLVFLEDLLRTFEHLPKKYQDKDCESKIRSMIDRIKNPLRPIDRQSLPSIQENEEDVDAANAATTANATTGGGGEGSIISMSPPPSVMHPSASMDAALTLTAMMNQSELSKTEISPTLAALFPMTHCRDTYLRTSRWNTRIDTIYKFLESVRNMLLQQVTNAAQHAANNNTASSSGGGVAVPVLSTAEAEELDEEYNLHKKQIADVVLEDLHNHHRNNNVMVSTDTFAPSEKLSFAHPVSNSNNNNSNNSNSNSYQREDDFSIVGQPVADSSLSLISGVGVTNNNNNNNNNNNSSSSTDASGIASLNALYKAAFDQTNNYKKTADNNKPIDKVSKITKALSKFLVLGNKDSNFEGNHKFFVPLGDFGTGRYGLPPGRNGVVIPVAEDVYASIIAYSLASNEYYQALQASIREDFSDSYDTGDASTNNNNNTNTAAAHNHSNNNTNNINNNNTNSGDGNHGNHAADKTVTAVVSGAGGGEGHHHHHAGLTSKQAPAESDLLFAATEKQKKQKKKKSSLVDNKDDDDAEEDEEDDEDEEEEEDLTVTTNLKRKGGGNNYGITKLMNDFNNSDEVNAQHGHQDVSAFGGGNNRHLFGPSSAKHPHNHQHDDDSGVDSQHLHLHLTTDEPLSPRSLPSEPTLVDNDNHNNYNNNNSQQSSRPLTNHTTSTSEKSSSSSSRLPDKKGTDGGSNDNNSSSVSSNEKQLLSQDKSIIRHRFDDYDDRGMLTCKFQCQIYYAKQFEAMRNCYFKDDDNLSRDNYIRSLALTARWSAQGGKSGASFSKTMDERLVIKVISKVELQMFLDFAPAYFGNVF
jgi:hypothetical protein